MRRFHGTKRSSGGWFAWRDLIERQRRRSGTGHPSRWRTLEMGGRSLESAMRKSGDPKGKRQLRPEGIEILGFLPSLLYHAACFCTSRLARPHLAVLPQQPPRRVSKGPTDRGRAAGLERRRREVGQVRRTTRSSAYTRSAVGKGFPYRRVTTFVGGSLPSLWIVTCGSPLPF